MKKFNLLTTATAVGGISCGAGFWCCTIAVGDLDVYIETSTYTPVKYSKFNKGYASSP